MTQAVNLANFANNLNSSGQVDPNALSSNVPVTKGGTGANSASAARSALGLAIGSDIPAKDGTGATGTWNISISGNAATATSASTAGSAGSVTNGVYTTGDQNIGGVKTFTNGIKLADGITQTAAGIGFSQSWQVVSRSLGTTYTNSTTRPIEVAVQITLGNGQTATLSVGGVVVARNVGRDGAYIQNTFSGETLYAIVPPNATYIASGGSLVQWTELR